LEIFGGFEEKIFKKIEVGEKPLEFSELKARKVDVAAQMIFESVLKVGEENHEEYLRFCNHIQKYKFQFVDSVKKQVKEKTVTLIVCPMIESFDWTKIERFGKFLAMLENNFKVLRGKLILITKFFEEVFKRLEDVKNQSVWTKIIKIYQELAEDHLKLTLIENVWIFDKFCESEFRENEFQLPIAEDFNRIYNSLIYKLNMHFYNEINEPDSLIKLSPSSMIFFNHLLNKQTYKENVLIINPKNFAKFFVQTAAARIFDEPMMFIKQLIAWKKMKPSEFKFKGTNEVQFVNVVVEMSKQQLDEFVAGKVVENFKHIAYGFCLFISELYVHGLMTANDYENVVDKIAELAKAKTTELTIHCYHTIVVAPISEMRKKKDEKLLHKALESQKEFVNILDTVQTNITFLRAKHLNDEKILSKSEISSNDDNTAGTSSEAKKIVQKMKEDILNEFDEM
jgi:hypothetical protein